MASDKVVRRQCYGEELKARVLVRMRGARRLGGQGGDGPRHQRQRLAPLAASGSRRRPGHTRQAKRVRSGGDCGAETGAGPELPQHRSLTALQRRDDEGVAAPLASAVTGELSDIAALVEVGGEITLGYLDAVSRCVATSCDDAQCLAMLVRRKGETLDALLQRLDTAIADAYKNGRFIDEVNTHFALGRAQATTLKLVKTGPLDASKSSRDYDRSAAHQPVRMRTPMPSGAHVTTCSVTICGAEPRQPGSTLVHLGPAAAAIGRRHPAMPYTSCDKFRAYR
jgi:hypothetical protein